MLAVISLGIVALTLNWFDVATAFPLIGARVQGGPRVAELPHLALHRRLRALPHPRRHARHRDRHEEDPRARAARAGDWPASCPGCRTATPSSPSSGSSAASAGRCSSPSGPPRWSSGSATRTSRCARHHRRRRLQRGGRLRALRLAVRAARDELAHVADPGRRLRAARHAGDRCGLPGPGRRPVARRRQVRPRRPAGRAREQGSVDLRRRASRRIRRVLHHLAAVQRVRDARRHFDPSAGGLLSALIVLAGIPGSLLGGYWADRSRNLRMFVVGPLIVVAALLALIPVVPTSALWVLGIGIGFFLIFGFAAWLAVPARVCDIEHRAHRHGDRPDAHAGRGRRLLHPRSSSGTSSPTRASTPAGSSSPSCPSPLPSSGWPGATPRRHRRTPRQVHQLHVPRQPNL